MFRTPRGAGPGLIGGLASNTRTQADALTADLDRWVRRMEADNNPAYKTITLDGVEWRCTTSADGAWEITTTWTPTRVDTLTLALRALNYDTNRHANGPMVARKQP